MFQSLLTCLFLMSSWAQAQSALWGPYAVGTGEYRLPAQIYTDILADRKTEIWARVFWPKDAVTGALPMDLPLVGFLHGNHETCGSGEKPRYDDNSNYTTSGVCPSGYVVTPNHEGYNYIAEQLASYGYVVFSINANRGITAGSGIAGDSGLNFARGKLILKHLELWSRWTTQGQAPLSLNGDKNIFLKKINMSYVGLMGHSRGGEGVRAAYTLYNEVKSPWVKRISQLKIKSIFEIGAVDGQTSRTLDAPNVVWNQLIPVCDGDVSDFAGIRPFHRMIQLSSPTGNEQKSVSFVYGANHNFFNSEWYENDSSGCYNHQPLWSVSDWSSDTQRAVAQKMVVDFFRAHLKSSLTAKISDTLNPLVAVDPVLASLTRVERDFVVNPNTSIQMRFDDFNLNKADVIRESSANVKTVVERGRLDLNSQLNIKWDKNGTLKLIRTQTVNISKMKTLDLRLSLAPEEILTEALNFSIRLTDEKENQSNAVEIKNYITKLYNPFYGNLFQTVRIPIEHFTGIDFSHLKKIEMEFLAPASSQVFLANIRFSSKANVEDTVVRLPLISRPLGPTAGYGRVKVAEGMGLAQDTDQGNKILKVELVSRADFKQKMVSVTLTSARPFKVRNALPVLSIEEHIFDLSKIENDISGSRITFYLPWDEYNMLKNFPGPIKVYYFENPKYLWIFENTLSQFPLVN